MKSLKRLFLSFLLSIAPITGAISVSAVTSGCNTTQTQQVHTLEAVGVSAKASIDTAALLLKNGEITVEQWDDVAAIHRKFLIAYSFAVKAVKSDLTQNSPAEAITLSIELAKTVSKLRK
jgi:hypothetical protein